jgi:phage tail-like protein
MAIGVLPENLLTNRFYVELSLDGSQENIDAIFLECTGFTYSQDLVEICEVTPRKWGKAQQGLPVRTKIPGNVKMGNITLRRCLSHSMTLWNWFADIQQGNWAKKRRDFSLTIQDSTNTAQTKLQFSRAWVTSYKISDFHASKADMAIEELEIAFEDFKRVASN